jgi:hypothetical protein
MVSDAMCDDDERLNTVPPPPPIPRASWSIKKAQEFLKRRGYVLTALGPFRVSFYAANVKRDKHGLIPEDQWHHLSDAQFRAFVRDLGGTGEPE